MIVFDAGALIALVNAEAGDLLVKQLLSDHRGECVIHAVNLLEIHYDAERAQNASYAQQVIEAISNAELSPEPTLTTHSCKTPVFSRSITKCRSPIRSASLWRGVWVASSPRPTITNSTP